MGNDRLIYGVRSVDVVGPELIGAILLSPEREEVKLGLEPHAARILMLALLHALNDGTRQGTLPQHLSPMIDVAISPEARPSGVLVTYEMSDGLSLEGEMPWKTARELASRLTALCDAQERGASKAN